MKKNSTCGKKLSLTLVYVNNEIETMSDRHSVRKKCQRYGWFISSGINPLFLNSIVLTKTCKAFGFNVIVIFLKYVIFRAQLLMLSSIEKKVV